MRFGLYTNLAVGDRQVRTKTLDSSPADARLLANQDAVAEFYGATHEIERVVASVTRHAQATRTVSSICIR